VQNQMSSSTAIHLLFISQKYAFSTSCIIFIIGIIGNLFNILVFTTLKLFRNNRCVLYFITESIANIVQLTFFFLIYLLIEVNGTDPASVSLFWCKFRSTMIVLCTLISFSAVCLSAYDQCLSTSHQFNIRRLSTTKLTQYLIFIIICISIFNVTLFCIFVEIRGTLCSVYNSNMLNYLSFFYYPVLTGLLPIFITSLFSILAYRNVRRIFRRQIPILRRRLDQQLTAMVLARVILFIVLILPYTIQRMYAYIAKVNQSDLTVFATNSLIGSVLTTFFILNYAVRFY